MTLRKSHFIIARILAFTLVISVGSWVYGIDALFPKPTRLVSDTATVLLPGEVDQLEARLQRLRDSGLAQAIVYVAPSLPDGTRMEDLTSQAMKTWGATNNGLAIFVFIKDRRARIEVGRGLETRISNAAAAAIVEEQTAPLFRLAKYGEGLNAAIDKIEAMLRQSTPALVSRDDVQYVKTPLGVSRRIVGVMNAPRVTRRVFPRLPGEARQAGTRGLVQMEVLIDTSGRVNKVHVTNGLPNGLSEAAVEAVKQWVFEPVVVGDTAMPALIDVVVSFKH